MKYIKYTAGSLIISFGIILVVLILLNALHIEPPEDIATYLGIAWILLAIATYPLAKRIVRV